MQIVLSIPFLCFRYFFLAFFTLSWVLITFLFFFRKPHRFGELWLRLGDLFLVPTGSIQAGERFREVSGIALGNL